ncbi:hypothetical protein AU476_38635 [Cupriavidus sp. UYMSc13B]|nr:hypothetical protein AU476_38635 [Cupriavidus sp. UYMSc13B]
MPVFHTLPEWLAHLETAHPVGIDMGLARITRVKEALGLRIDAVVFTVGGTNGKGSTCAMLERILLEAGYKVGCHTSPHLISFNERARINGEIATDAQLLPHFEAIGHRSLSKLRVASMRACPRLKPRDRRKETTCPPIIHTAVRMPMPRRCTR